MPPKYLSLLAFDELDVRIMREARLLARPTAL